MEQEKDKYELTPPAEKVVATFTHRNTTFLYDTVIIITYIMVVVISLTVHHMVQRIFAGYSKNQYIVASSLFAIFLFIMILTLVYVTKIHLV